MNLKIKIILFAGVFLMSMGSAVYSQGVFKNNSTSTGEVFTTKSKPASTDAVSLGNTGLFRSGNKPPGGGGNVPGEEMPVGEGLAILSLLSGGYIMLKKRRAKDGQ
ncbi:MAG: hypothetical protein LBG45_06275 [Dysgonamonadaceae bacterium]|jgi:hypothetical protein|nr:hypothetical protein [Dysgonamonadaceae bacterium]